MDVQHGIVIILSGSAIDKGPLVVHLGVEYLYGKSLYLADPRASRDSPRELGRAYATKEVIVSGGTFNSPQILKLSGIGPKAELDRFGIPVIVDLPENLSNYSLVVNRSDSEQPKTRDHAF